MDGPEHNGRLLCSRCGAAFDAKMLREFDAILRAEGMGGIKHGFKP